MYSSAIRKALKGKKIGSGDRIRVKKGKQMYEGILVPKGDAGDPNSLVIKLDTGYNIGVSFKGASLSKLSASREGLGKVRKEHLNLKWNPKKPAVSLISTGGTIISRVDYRTGGVYAIDDPQEFLHNIPELANIISLKRVVKPVNVMSEDMDHSDWVAIAKAVHKELCDPGVKGVIVTHGTDTLHYTAAALNFFLSEVNKPVVLVGSQKSADRGSSDAGMNLICAAHAAISDIAEIGTCMHGSINDDYCFFIKGVRVRKMNTVRRDAFRPINDFPLAKIYPDGKIESLKSYRKRSSKKPTLDTSFEPRIALIKAFPGSDPSILEHYMKSGYKGFVIEGMGLGHVPTQSKKSWIPAVKKAVKKGIPVVVTSQTIYGRVNSRVYSNLRILYLESGAIPGEDMLSEAAYIKLGHVLGKTKDPKKVRELMTTNIAGEISECSLPETFLY